MNQAAFVARAANEDVPADRPAYEPPACEPPAYELIELFFFAYRDFVGDPDRILDDYGFGRAHHRVLHFVDRRSGLTVAELLDILRITKQSLNRVLKELVDKGFIESRTGTADRRQRHLVTTPAGHELALSLARLQSGRIARALAEARGSGQGNGQGSGQEDGAAAARRFLLGMIDGAEGRPA